MKKQIKGKKINKDTKPNVLGWISVFISSFCWICSVAYNGYVLYNLISLSSELSASEAGGMGLGGTLILMLTIPLSLIAFTIGLISFFKTKSRLSLTATIMPSAYLLLHLIFFVLLILVMSRRIPL
jgi:hypothetical protein